MYLKLLLKMTDSRSKVFIIECDILFLFLENFSKGPISIPLVYDNDTCHPEPKTKLDMAEFI